MTIPGMPPGPLPGTPGSPEWLALQATVQSSRRRGRLANGATASQVGGLEETVDVHIVPTDDQRRARMIIGVVMAVTFIAFAIVFVVVATHIMHSTQTP